MEVKYYKGPKSMTLYESTFLTENANQGTIYIIDSQLKNCQEEIIA